MADTAIQLTNQVQAALDKANVDLAFDAYKQLEQQITSQQITDPEQLIPLDRLRAKLAAICMRFLAPDSLKRLLNGYPVSMVDVPISDAELIDHLRDFLSNEPFVEDRNAIRDQLKKSLEQSSQRLGNQLLKLGSELVQPSIRNWFRVYVSDVGTGQASTIQLARFFAQNENVKLLKDQEKVLLRRILTIYEFLKLRSQDLAGNEDLFIVEEDDGKVQMVSDGKIVNLFDAATLNDYEQQAKDGTLTLSELVYLREKFPERFGVYRMPNKNRGPILDEPEELEDRVQRFFEEQMANYGSQTNAIHMQVPSQPEQVVELVLSLIQSKDTDSVLKVKDLLMHIVSDPDRFTAFFSHNQVQQYIQQQLPAVMSPQNQALLKQAGVSPIGFQALLQRVFLEEFSLDVSQATWYCYQIIQSFPFSLKDYKTLLTYDPIANNLVWRY